MLADSLRSARPPMRVVYLNHVAQLSGGEIALLRLIPHLPEVQAHVILATDGPLTVELAKAGISSEVLPMAERTRDMRKDAVTVRSIRPAMVFDTTRYVLRLARRLRQLRPDIVHTNSLKAGVYGSVAARLAGVPVVWHVRDRIATDYLPAAAVWGIRLMTRRLASAVVANSRATMDTLDPRAHPVIVHSVVPKVTAPPAGRDGRLDGPLTVGLIGRVAPWKGQDLFLRAFAEAFPEGEARCVLVGAPMFGEDEYERDLRALSTQLGLGARAEFSGFRADVWSELARMDILVHASCIPEPFGQVVLEGMAAGVPVIAADAGGPSELITHDRNGVLYPMGDQSALATAMRELGSDPERRKRLAVGGLASAADYHPDAVAERLQRLYRSLARNCAAPCANTRAAPRVPPP